MSQHTLVAALYNRTASAIEITLYKLKYTAITTWTAKYLNKINLSVELNGILLHIYVP